MKKIFNLLLSTALVTVLTGCDDSTETPDVDTTPPEITLVGETLITLAKGDSYQEGGATAQDDTDGQTDVVMSGSVYINTPGTYVLTYTATDSAGNESSIIRTIIVESLPDEVAPVIDLIGDDVIAIVVGSDFTDEGANATDDVDGNLIATVSGEVNIDEIGSYTLTYTATDNAGNTSSVTRQVQVTAEPIEGDAYLFHSDFDDSYFVEYWGDTWGTGTVYTDQPTDSTYAKALEITKSNEWGTVVAWGNDASNSIDISQYNLAKFKVKANNFTQVQVFVQSPSNVNTEIVYNLSNGTSLNNGWIEMSVRLPSFTDMNWFALNFIGDSGTLLMADLYFTYEEIEVTGPPTSAPEPSNLNNDDIIVLYSDNLIQDRWISVWNSNWWNAPVYAEGDIGGNHFAKYEITDGGTDGGVTGLEFGFEIGALNANNTTTWNFDLYVEPGISKISLQLASTDGSATYNIDNPTAGTWVSYAIPFNNMTDNDGGGPGVMSQGGLQAAGIQLWGTAGKSIYVDNIYFSGIADLYDTDVLVQNQQGQVLSNAKVTAGAVEATSNDSGIATLRLPSGEHRFLVDAEGYGVKQSNYSVSAQANDHTVSVIPMEAGPTEAAPTPTLTNEEAIVIYSDSLIVDKYISYWSDNWWNAPTHKEVSIAGDSFAQLTIIPNGEEGGITGIQYGIEGGPLIATDTTRMRFDLFVTDGISKIEIQLLSSTGPGLYTVNGYSKGQWVTIDIPYSDFRDSQKISPSTLTQLGVQLWGTTSDSIYLDNILFY